MPAKHFAVKNLFAIQLRRYQQTEQTLHLSSLQVAYLCCLALPVAEQTLLCKHRINAVSEEHPLYPEIQLGVTGLE